MQGSVLLILLFIIHTIRSYIFLLILSILLGDRSNDQSELIDNLVCGYCFHDR